MNELIAKATGEITEASVKQANNFLSKLFGPSLEERGEIIKDNVRFRRWENQIHILEKARKILKEKKSLQNKFH